MSTPVLGVTHGATGSKFGASHGPSALGMTCNYIDPMACPQAATSVAPAMPAAPKAVAAPPAAVASDMAVPVAPVVAAVAETPASGAKQAMCTFRGSDGASVEMACKPTKSGKCPLTPANCKLVA